MKIAIACGGTGGHLLPGLATAQVLKERGHAVSLWVSGRAVENRIIQSWDGPVVAVRSEGFPSGFSFASLAAAARLLAAMVHCRSEMRRYRPDVLLGMGSYATVGPGLAARWLGIPIVLHEANAVPGKAVEFLSRFAAAIAVSCEPVKACLHHSRIEETGLPVRPELVRRAAEAADAPRRDPPAVLIMGGSQGAHRLNELACEALGLLARKGVAVRAIHLAGQADEAMVRESYARSGVAADVHGFLSDMGAAYAAAGLVIARSGGSSCAEVALFGLPTLFVPYPYARRDHQAANARVYAEAGAAVLVRQEDLTAARIATFVEEGVLDRGKAEAMRGAMRRLARPDAAARLARLVEDVGSGR